MTKLRASSAALAVILAACVGPAPVHQDEPAPDAGGSTGDPGSDPGPGEDPIEGDDLDTVSQMLAAFGDCMRYEDWRVLGLINLANESTYDGDPCESCHSEAGTGAVLRDDKLETYRAQREQPTILRLAVVIHDSTGASIDVAPNDRYVVKGQEEGLHPRYELSPDIVRGLDRFFDLTYARFAAQGSACERDIP